MDRFVHSLVEASEEVGYHVLLFPGDDEDPVGGYDNLLRSTAVDAFVVTDTYLGNPQAAWLSQQRAPFVAFGRPWDDEEAPPRRGSTSTARPASGWPPQHLIDRGHTRIAWIGWRKDSPIGEDRRSGWLQTMHANGLSTTGLASRVEDVVHSGAEAAAVLLDESRAHGLRLRLRHPRDGRAPHALDPPARAGHRHRGRRLRRLPGGAGLPGGPDVRTPTAGGRRRSRSSRPCARCSSHQPVAERRRAPRADARDPRVQLSSWSTGSGSPSSPEQSPHRTRGDAVARRDDDFVAFVDARSAALLRTARLLTAGDQHAAEDLVQTALEKAYVAWPRIQRKRAQEAYVRSIMTRAAIDRTRQRSRRGEVRDRRGPRRARPPRRPRGPRPRLRPAAVALAATARGDGAALLRRPLRGADRRGARLQHRRGEGARLPRRCRCMRALRRLHRPLELTR